MTDYRFLNDFFPASDFKNEELTLINPRFKRIEVSKNDFLLQEEKIDIVHYKK